MPGLFQRMQDFQIRRTEENRRLGIRRHAPKPTREKSVALTPPRPKRRRIFPVNPAEPDRKAGDELLRPRHLA
jgi:hypothetical protein